MFLQEREEPDPIFRADETSAGRRSLVPRLTRALITVYPNVVADQQLLKEKSVKRHT